MHAHYRSLTWRHLTGTCAAAAVLLVPLPGPQASAASPAPQTSHHAGPAAPAAPRVSAQSWIVTDADDGRVLAAKDAHRRMPPASTLKTLFALTVLPKLSASAVHRAAASDVAGVAAGSSLAGVHDGTRYSVADLWRGVFLASGNDAVHTLARMNGGPARTVEDMQRTARRLGARDTEVRSPDGFDAPGQYSSAYDLALIARAGMKNPDFRHYMGTKSARFPATGGPDSFGIQNTNRLLVGSHGVTPYPGLIGVKNGYTSNAGHTLVAAAQHGTRTILVTLMNPRSGSANTVYDEARSLLDWGFAAAPHARQTALLNGAPPKPLSAPASGQSRAPGVPPQAGTPGDEDRFDHPAGLALVALAVLAFPLALLRGRRRRSRQSEA
ncbi:serine hydrolase [Streptomyces sp. NPDC050264]|uniref:D-alanyl-D-alanine carboxypeptidase family protein n=1 Tax=Streptomyces sp. NPDC050264 TaxID=3155038 RepID=UPI003445AEAE